MPRAPAVDKTLNEVPIGQFHPVDTLPNGAPQYFHMLTPGVYNQINRGPDGLTDSERVLNPDPAAWGRDPQTDPVGPRTDDSKDIEI